MFPFIEGRMWQVTTWIKRYVWKKLFRRMISFWPMLPMIQGRGDWKGHMGIGKNTSSKLVYQRNQKLFWGEGGKH